MSVISNLTVRLAADTVAFDNVMRQSTRGLQQLKQIGVDVFNATRTPVEKYEAALKRLGAVYHSGNTDQETYERSLKQLKDELFQASGTADKLRSHLQALNGQMAGAPAGTVGRLGAGWRSATTAAGAFAPRLGMLTGALSGYAAVAGAHHAFDLAADFEASAISMEVLLRDADRAQGLIRTLYDYAAKTPFEFPDVVMAGKQLIGYGEDADQVMTDIKMLGNVATALQIPLTELANVFGRNRNQLQLYTRDINELANRGVPVIQYLAQHFGVATTDIRDMVEAGQVGFEDLRAAMEAMSGPGGQFEGMTDRLGKSMKGVASTAKDDLASAMRELGDVIGTTVLPKISTLAKEIAGISKQLAHPEQAGIPESLKSQQDFNAVHDQVANASSTAGRLEQLKELHDQIFSEQQALAERMSNISNPFTVRFDATKAKSLQEQMNGLMRERVMLENILKQQTDQQSEASKYVAESIREWAPAISSAIDEFKGPAGKMFDTLLDGVDKFKAGFRSAVEDAKAGANEVALARKIIAETRTPQERFERDMKELDNLRKRSRINEETFRRGADAAQKRLDDMNPLAAEGKRLHESLKAPAEKFADELRHLRDLQQRGAISNEDFDRARGKAEEDFRNSGPELSRTAHAENRALTSGTTEALSAIHRAASKSAPDKQRDEREKQMLDIERRMEILDRQQLDALRNMRVLV